MGREAGLVDRLSVMGTSFARHTLCWQVMMTNAIDLFTFASSIEH